MKLTVLLLSSPKIDSDTAIYKIKLERYLYPQLAQEYGDLGYIGAGERSDRKS
jgi:hypothetical protein